MSIVENNSGAHIGNISGSIDPENDVLTYSIVEGEGDHIMFRIMNNMLYLKTDVVPATMKPLNSIMLHYGLKILVGYT